MNNRWSDSDAAQVLSHWGETLGTDLALRLYTARLIGSDPALVLHGGGNVSVKCRRRAILGDEIDVIHIKASGADMASLSPEGLPAAGLKHLVRLRDLEQLNDDAMVSEIRSQLINPDSPTPSVETLLHAFLPHKFVDHSHADAILCLTNQNDGARLVREALGDGVPVVPYVKPGFGLAKAVAATLDENPGAEGVVLLQHGLLTFADDARTSYERHIEIVDVCERFIRARIAQKRLTVAFESGKSPADLAARVAPILRGLVAQQTNDADRPVRRKILEWRAGGDLLRIINSREMSRLASAGALTGDHVVRTGPRHLLVENPSWSDSCALRKQLEQAVSQYSRQYADYIARYGGETYLDSRSQPWRGGNQKQFSLPCREKGRGEDEDTKSRIDLAPCVILLPGAGMFCWGPTKRDAVITADIAEHTLQVKGQAELIGSYQSLPDQKLFEMEFRGLQRRKLGHRSDAALIGQVVLISGAAGAIGSAVAEVCAEAGAHVVLTDIDFDGLAPIMSRIEERSATGLVHAIRMDVTDESSVAAAFEEVACTYGGVDVVVPNAGVAHVAVLTEIKPDEFRRVMDVNATGYLLFMQAGARMMIEQGTGGNIVVISSKNVLAPGKEFGAYSASKAAAHQLGKMAAIELAEHGIRVNMIAPDAIFGEQDLPSKLWETVGPQRAAARGLQPDDLPEYYRERNLLKARVTGRHVGHAVVFFASNATPTTGATLPIDGGLPDAFPR
jgi:rhamnose utilization protein RhaD (predicted bifunctional aldolase and dehydrogenase)/NAD(P)-dependent dehydrogenase (short-subunit alcohol dehydrogenase family)